MVTFFKKVKKILTIIAKIIIPYPSSTIPLELDIFYPCLHLFIKMKEIRKFTLHGNNILERS